MPTNCVFQLDRSNGTFVSGECITGRILLRTERAKRVNAVFVTLEGEAKVQWSINGKGETANYYYGHQQYLYTRTNVFTNGHNSDFQAGTHVYVLSLRIPPDCPSSCKGPYGYIAYSISVTIDKPWSLDEVFRQPVTVVQSLNLNVNPEFALPVHDENVKYLCNWPCRSGPIASTLVLPAAGFVPAQPVPYVLEIDNQSPHYDVVGVEASIKQHFVFLARKPLKRNYYTKTLAKSSIDERTLRLTKRLYEGSVCVPEGTPRSTLNPNYIVFLHYTLHVKLKTGCFHFDMAISVPIVVGTVPLWRRNVFITTQPTLRSREQLNVDNASPIAAIEPRQEQCVASASTQRKCCDDEPPSYDSCLPPSFSFATLGSQQTLDDAASPLPERQRIHITLPKFPGYNTFASPTQAINVLDDSMFDMDIYNSFGSLDTDHTGRSLDTFDSSCGNLSETEEVAEEQGESNL